MKVSIEGTDLVIRIEMENPPALSASTRGNVVTSVQVQGKPVTVGVNAYIKA